MTLIKNKPLLRFPEFKSTWKENKISEIFERVVNPVDVDKTKKYQEIGIRSHGKGIFHKEQKLGVEIGNKRVFWVKENTFIVNIVFAWEQAVAKTTENEVGLIASHRFPMYEPIKNVLDLGFILYFFLRKKGKYVLELASPGGAGRNKTLGQKVFADTEITIPKFQEQAKIARFLNRLDSRINLIDKKLKKLKAYKIGVRRKIFSKELRFKDVYGNEFPDWKKMRIGDVLDYEQPTKYLVSNKDYNKKYNTPVLTAGKKFILGYTKETDGIFIDNLPTIIFDDFTTAFHFVDFPFKAKSSAMKMLIPKGENVNMKFMYEAMKSLRFPIAQHKRFWISEYQNQIILYPNSEEQQKISDFFLDIDNSIQNLSDQLTKSKKFKKGLLQKMFV
ncbi:restriction endonuclease subunit S [uncultured Polaribacter sp.]|uniref:restriction endonuclease subunit S n=1 Tax=uncultured Polaribacter sp. TaxID=174711 RepID=UPI002621AF74|nr:restriction endonuclease subunit S [uncultured Polaribacter sp.]